MKIIQYSDGGMEVGILNGKTAIITGCLKGIGRSTMDLFAHEGADIFACAQYMEDEFENHIESIRSETGVNIYPVYFDLSEEKQVKEAVTQIRNNRKDIDILVNIAGYTKDAMFQMVSMRDLIQVFQINYFSQILFTQFIVKMMIKTGGGSIINTSSVAALDGSAGQLAYGASKAALANSTIVMARELAKNKIRVNAIAPGLIDTDMYIGVPEEVINNKIEHTKLKRMGEAEEVAKTILFLASEKSSHITGQIVRIDGGRSTL